MKLQWKRLKKHFGKPPLKLISKIEYKENRCLIRTSSQIKIEEAMIRENSKRFTLAYSSSLFSPNIL